MTPLVNNDAFRKVQFYRQTLMRAFFRLVVATILVFGVAGCTSVSYYAQALQGHVKIMSERQDVGKLIENPSTPEALRDRMVSALEIRQFATDELALPDNKSYRSYVDVGQDAVTWAVFAAPEFSLTPHVWCFAVYGCVPYLGFFSKKSAAEFALELQRKGLDVHVTGITAYSTLGWSSDPLLSTMLTRDDTYLAGLVFHELAHQRLYIHGDSDFNEAFAVSVETSGVRKWLRAAGNTAGLRRYEADRKRRADFLALVSQTREELRHVYASSGTVSEKRVAKAAAIERLRTRYRQLRDTSWRGYRGYDAWFDAPINNAKLAVISVYGDQVTAFLRLFDLCSRDYPRFYASVEQLGKLNKADRARALKAADRCYDAGQS
jgi:predicted aminopeptidase